VLCVTSKQYFDGYNYSKKYDFHQGKICDETVIFPYKSIIVENVQIIDFIQQTTYSNVQMHLPTNRLPKGALPRIKSEIARAIILRNKKTSKSERQANEIINNLFVHFDTPSYRGGEEIEHLTNNIGVVIGDIIRKCTDAYSYFRRGFTGADFSFIRRSLMELIDVYSAYESTDITPVSTSAMSITLSIDGIAGDIMLIATERYNALH